MNPLPKIKSLFSMTTLGLVAATALSGCAISNDPAVNTMATVATIGTAAALFYSASDDYYYDDRYNRLPRSYQPAYNARIHRIANMDDYRRQYPLNHQRVVEQRQQNRLLQQHLEQQRDQNHRLREQLHQQQRLEQQRSHNQHLRERLQQQQRHNTQLQERINRQQRIQPQRPAQPQWRERVPQQRHPAASNSRFEQQRQQLNQRIADRSAARQGNTNQRTSWRYGDR